MIKKKISKKKKSVSIDIVSVEDTISHDKEIYTTVDDERIKMAKNLINDYKNLIKDDFFEKDDENDINEKIVNKMHDNLLKKAKKDKLTQSENFTQKIENKNFDSFLLKGHKKTITKCKIYKDLLVSVSKDKSIIIWDLLDKSKFILSYGIDKDINGHKEEILCLDISYDGKYLITGGKDKVIKCWDLFNKKFIGNMNGHNSDINDLKFKFNSYQFCSVSSKRTLKLWDATQLCFILNLHGHKNKILKIEVLTDESMVTIGEDKQAYIWKLDKLTQLIYNERSYWLDSLCVLNKNSFLTGSQDGELALWNVAKKKPIFTKKNIHLGNWITSLSCNYNSDIFFSGAHDNKINIYKYYENENKFEKINELYCEGIINNIEIDRDLKYICIIESSELLFGRWITKNKIKNKIRIYKFN